MAIKRKVGMNDLYDRIARNHQGNGLLLLLVLLLGTVVAMIGIYSYVAVQVRYHQDYRELADTLRSSTQQIDKYAGLAANGDMPAFSSLKKNRDRFELAILQLQGGSVETGLPAFSDDPNGALEKVAVLWRKYRNNTDTILAYQENVYQLQEALQGLKQRLPDLLSISEKVASGLVQKEARAGQVYAAARQLVLLERIGKNLDLVVASGADRIGAMDRFGEDLDRFVRIINGMLNGDQLIGVVRVRHKAVRRQLVQLSSLAARLTREKRGIEEALPVVSQVGAVAADIDGSTEALLAAIEKLEEGFAGFDSSLRGWTLLSYLLAAAALILLLLIAFRFRREDKLRLAASEEQKSLSEAQNKRNQQAILRLLDEMGNLADGDLTVQATVNEEITGAIADSVNYAVDALRHLVRSINDTTLEVSGAAQDVQATTQRLAVDSGKQADQIRESAMKITDMARAVEKISADAALLAEEAKRSVESADKGAEAVRDTVRGMDVIREQIQKTSKRIKRLGESSQEIGNIVGLIGDIAEQTSILALNASLQSAMAGESDSAFSSVAKEIQQLAERSASATQDIETLVKTIQADTQEAVVAMEQTTEGVVSGTRLARDAGEYLDDIDRTARHLADLIQNISSDARGYAESASDVSEGMKEIQSLSLLTSEGLNKATAAIGHLARSVNTLKKSVAGFKLPH